MAWSQEEVEICCICLHGLGTPDISDEKLPCGHVLHEQCVTEMRRQGASARCPVCRESHPERLLTVANMVDKATQEFLLKNFAESYQLLSQAHNVDSDHDLVNFFLGGLCHKGLGVLKDLGRASEYYEAAHACNLDAANNLGILCQEHGDIPKARMFYEEASAKGHLSATCNLADLCEKQGDIPSARMFHEEARAKGHLGAICRLGVLCEEQGDIPRGCSTRRRVPRAT